MAESGQDTKIVKTGHVKAGGDDNFSRFKSSISLLLLRPSVELYI